jgi:hypothetical protein
VIIVGDIASPSKNCTEDLRKIFKTHNNVFKDQLLVANLEGLIGETEILQSKTPVLFNHPNVVEVLKEANTIAVGLANNHTLDLPNNFKNTTDLLSAAGIKMSGAGHSFSQATDPVIFRDREKEIIFFNYCWDFLLYHQKNPTNGIYISPIQEVKILKEVERAKKTYPEASILIFFHWSFDLETLPFPLYRKFSRDLIDVGANVVVGCHSHCIQGGEKYKNGHIVYGLGNFYLPHNIFANGQLSFPEWSKIQLALEWNTLTNACTCHWFQYVNIDGKHILNFLQSENFESSEILKKYSPYAGMTDIQYRSYYKENRRKKILIPVFHNYNKKFTNAIKLLILKSRAKVARFMAKTGIIRWQN